MEVQNSISHNSYDSFNLIPDTIPDSWEVHSKGIGRILNYIQAEMALSYLQNHDVDNASKYYYLSYKNGNVSLENYFSETLNAREPFTKDTIKEGLINYLN